mgnify:CR=1 FL=1
MRSVARCVCCLRPRRVLEGLYLHEVAVRVTYERVEHIVTRVEGWRLLNHHTLDRRLPLVPALHVACLHSSTVVATGVSFRRRRFCATARLRQADAFSTSAVRNRSRVLREAGSIVHLRHRPSPAGKRRPRARESTGTTASRLPSYLSRRASIRLAAPAPPKCDSRGAWAAWLGTEHVCARRKPPTSRTRSAVRMKSRC